MRELHMPPPIRKPRPPSIAVRTAHAVELGLVEPGVPLSPKLQIAMANLHQLAVQNEDAEERAAAADPVPEIADTYGRLVEAGLPQHAVARIVAALAPGIAARANQGAAHAPH